MRVHTCCGSSSSDCQTAIQSPNSSTGVDHSEEYRCRTTLFFISPNSSNGRRPQWRVSLSDRSTYLPLSEKDGFDASSSVQIYRILIHIVLEGSVLQLI
ncbi:hypothetical protein HAX54_021904 [Datura stramonium]|uniref:Uncharacterized protein n=1 Tax=Datura stramonium TaxID=4076 RepID=A0ABS8S3X6_DATST|nr:hypothetical protein [Datura stramonium]